MQVKYTCENEKCSYRKERGYELVVTPESILDEKNVATFFCPHCHQKLICEECRTAA